MFWRKLRQKKKGDLPLAENAKPEQGTRQKLLSGFFPLRGGVPPHSAKLFWAQLFSVKGGGDTPLRKKSAKKYLFLAKKCLF